MEVFKPCKEMTAVLERDWEKLRERQRTTYLWQLVKANCREAIPYLIRQLEAKDPFERGQALYGLGQLKCRDCRQLLIETHHNDPDESVRQTALLALNTIFKEEQDREILSLALAAFDDPASSVALRLAAGAVMMYQLRLWDDTGPGWWNEEEQDLQHHNIVRAVTKTRERLASTEKE
jgi:HEAT repeat protein